MNNNDSNIDLELAVKHITGNATKEESLLIQKWIDESEENKNLYSSLKETWISTGSTADLPEIDIDKEWNDFRNRHASTSLRRIWLRVAATVAIILAISATLLLLPGGNEKTLVADNGNVHFKFGDGSEIEVKKESSITYPETFAENERHIRLSGEGWFSVTPDKSRPFIVETEYYLVEVLGTSFFVKESSEPGNIIVTVESGKVAVQKKEKNDRIILTAGETVICSNESSEIKPSDNAILNDFSWKTNRMVFDNIPLSTIARSLRDIYGISIEFSDPSLENCMMTTTFSSCKPEVILDIIIQTFGWEYRKEGNKYIISGKSCGS